MISCGEHSQKGSGNQRTMFFSLVFLSLLFWGVSPILSLFCHQPCGFLGARVILSTFCSGWVDFQAPGCSFGVAVSAIPTGLTGLSLGDRFVCALGGSAAKQPTTNHISLAVSIYQALSSHRGQGSRQQLSDGGQLRVLAIDWRLKPNCPNFKQETALSSLNLTKGAQHLITTRTRLLLLLSAIYIIL